VLVGGRAGGADLQPRETSPETTHRLCRLYHVAGAEAAGADPDVLDRSLL